MALSVGRNLQISPFIRITVITLREGNQIQTLGFFFVFIFQRQMNSFWLGIFLFFFLFKYKNQLLVLTEAEFNSFLDVVQYTSEQLLQALTSTQHLQSLQQNRKCICKLITTRITAQARLTVCSCSNDEENLHYEQGENHSDQFLIYLIRFGVFYISVWIHHIRCFSPTSPSFRKVGRSQRRAVLKGTVCVLHKPSPLLRRPSN